MKIAALVSSQRDGVRVWGFLSRRLLWPGLAGLLLAGPMATPALAAVTGPRGTLYALGDSTGSGVGARQGGYVERLSKRLSEAGRSLRVENLADSGATTVDVLRAQVGRIRAGANGLVLIGIGANDLTSGTDPEVFRRRFESIVARVRERTEAPIVVSNVPDVSLASAIPPVWRAQLAARVDAYNAVIGRVARAHDLVVFDLCALTRRLLPAHPEYLSGDGFHPSDSGYEAWAAELWPVVRRLL